MTLEDRVVVVTGGARGIGRVLGQAFLDAGSKLVSIDVSWEGEDDLAATVQKQGGLTLTADVCDETSIAQVYSDTMDAFGAVDVLINNAGLRQRIMVPWMYVDSLDLEIGKWQQMFDVNVLGPLRVTKQFVRPMVERRRGSVINVGSSVADMAVGGMQPYAMSKAALKSWTLSLAKELERFNIAVNVFSPGMTWTTGSGESQDEQRRVLGMTTFPPAYRPESCVPLALLLAEQDARFTGRWIPDVIEWNLLHGHGGHDTWLYQPTRA